MKIALLDDKEYGLQQIKKSLPAGVEASIKWFATVAEFENINEKFDIVFLDYYLDIDRITGDQITDMVRRQTKLIIGFSSLESGNRCLLSAGVDYAVVKVSGYRNEPLENLFHEIL